MSIYIEDAIISNLLINTILILLTGVATNTKISFARVLFGSVLGCAFSVATNLANLPNFILVLLKLVCGLTITLAILGKITPKKFVATYATFLGLTFVFGGLCLSLQQLTNLKVEPIIALFIIICFAYILFGVFKKFYTDKKLNKFVYELKLLQNGKTQIIKAYLDSGNLLKDDQTGLPVIILNHAIFEDLLGVTLLDIMQGNLNKKLNGHYINYATISNSSKMFVCKIDKVSILEGGSFREINVLVGTTFVGRFAQDTQALLSPLAI